MACKGCTPIIGVDAQPVSSFAMWKSLGITHVVRNNTEGGRYTQLQWRQKAVEAGLKVIDMPSSNIAADHADPNLVAFVLPDEPDYHNWPVSMWSAPYATIRAGSTKPIFGNFAGPFVTAAADATPPYNGSKHIPFMPYVDWPSSDWYPLNRNYSRYPLSLVTKSMDLLSKWSGGKPQFAYIECSDINISAVGRSPTEDEMKTIVRSVMARADALGYIFFPTRESGDRGRGYQSFTSDGTTPSMKIAIQEINAEMMPKVTAPTVQYELLSDHTWRVKA